jgi:acyl CoA:acetate/3-ketoacid CoA transferase beta subunit
VLDVGSHAGYVKRLHDRRRPRPTTPRSPDEPASGQERLIVLAARAIADRVRTGGYDTLLAGIGSSHMAAWLAAESLRQTGHDVKVVAELGAYGFTPEVGDVFLFSLRHADRSEALSSVPEILGGMVAANPRALGVLAAAEIDQHGTINTSRAGNGRWLTGSGGANDIASSADCVVIATASRRRFVSEVSYRTSPGDRVHEVISQFGRFRRDSPGGAFRLSTWLPADGDEIPVDQQGIEASALEQVEQLTSWPAVVGDVTVEPPPAPDELALLRAFDPEGHYH